MQVTTVLRMLPEFMACELVWIEILRQSIQLRDYSNTSYENDANITTEPTIKRTCLLQPQTTRSDRTVRPPAKLSDYIEW